MLELLAATAPWSSAWLRLRINFQNVNAIDADLFSAPLRERLVWCDAAIAGREIGPFPVLQNLCVSIDSACLAYKVPIEQVFPAARHVHARLRSGSPSVQRLVTQLAPVAQNLSSLSLEESLQPLVPEAPHGERLRLGDQTELSASDHLACYTKGGRVKHATISDPISKWYRWFEASTSIRVNLDRALAASIKTGATRVPELHCKQATLYFKTGLTQDIVDAAVLLINAMRHVGTLDIGNGAQWRFAFAQLVPEVLLKAICAMPKLRTVSLPFSLFGAPSARLLCAALPASCVVKCDEWHLDRDGVPPRGMVVQRLFLAFDHTELIPAEPTDWTRRVQGPAFRWPLGAGFVALASDLAVVFPCVTYVGAPACSTSAYCFEQNDLRALRALCIALGPRLQCVNGLSGAHAATLCDPEMSRACPWLR